MKIKRKPYRYRAKIICVMISFMLTSLARNGACDKQSLPAWNNDSSFFPILCWNSLGRWKNPKATLDHGFASIQACQFTIGGFAKVEQLPECEKLGLKVFVSGQAHQIGRTDWENPKLTEAKIEQKMKDMAEQTRNNKAVIGYYICDEPNASMFPRLAMAVKYIKKYAPGKLAYINLFPNYATASQLGTKTYTQYLERFVKEVRPEVLSYDNYMVQYSKDMLMEDKVARYFDNLLAVRRVALKYKIPFWNIVSSNQIRPFTTIPSPANLGLQAYTTLAAGGRGVSWYTYYARSYGYAPISTNDTKTQTWYYLKEINRQLKILGPIMNHLTSIGVYFTSPTPSKNLPELPGKLVQDVVAETPIMVGEFKGDDGKDYVMIVNLSLEKSTWFTPSLHQEKVTISMISSADGKPELFNMEKGHWLVAGQGLLLKLLKL